MIQKLIKEYILESKSKNDEKSNYAIGLATTSYKFDQAYFSFPRKIKDWGYYFHIICPDSESANNVISYLKHHVDEFFLDMDSVNSKFCTNSIKMNNPNIKFRSLYPKNITTQSCIDLIEKKKNDSVFVFGHGDIAYNLFKELQTRNIKSHWCASRDSSSLKFQNMQQSFSKFERNDLKNEDTLFVNLCPYFSDFYKKLTEHPNIEIIDVASKGSFFGLVKNEINIVEISARLVNEISFVLNGNIYTDIYGRSMDDADNVYVSGGYNAKIGDIIVDDHNDPKFVIGISDGKGGFQSRINKRFYDYLSPNSD